MAAIYGGYKLIKWLIDENNVPQTEPTPQQKMLVQQNEYSILDRVKNLVSGISERPVENISNGHDVESLIGDSLQHVLLVIALEEEFQIEMNLSEALQVKTVSGLAKAITSQVSTTKTCPRCKVPLRIWEGRLQCWECGYPFK